jgi:hypothetical protein
MNLLPESDNFENQFVDRWTAACHFIAALKFVTNQQIKGLKVQSNKSNKSRSNHPRFVYQNRPTKTFEEIGSISKSLTKILAHMKTTKGRSYSSVMDKVAVVTLSLNRYLGQNDDCLSNTKNFLKETKSVQLNTDFDENKLKKN